MEPAQPSASQITPSPAAKSQLRDSLIFFVVGSVAFIAAIVAALLWEKEERNLSFDYDRQQASSVCMGLAWALCSIMSLSGLWKIEKARAGGLDTRIARCLQICQWLGLAAAVMLSWVFLNTPRRLPDFGEVPLFWVAPLLSMLVLTVSRLVSRYRAKDRIHRTFCLLLAGHLTFAIAAVLACQIDKNLMAGSGSQRSGLGDHFLDDWFHTLPVAFAALAVISYGWGAWNLFIARFRSHAGGDWKWTRRMIWIGVLITLSLIAWYWDQSLSAYFSEIVAIWTLAAAFAVGKFLAGIRRAGNPSLVRRLSFTAPLLLIALCLTVTTGILASAVTAADQRWRQNPFNNIQHDWDWYLPEFIRAPITRILSPLDRGLRDALLIAGLMPEADQKAAAINISSYSGDMEYWTAWASRNKSAALETALAVPEVPNPATSATKYDFFAGVLIASCCSNQEIHRRLTGSYSRELVQGILSGLRDETRGAFVEDIQSLIEGTTRAEPSAWKILIACDQDRATKLILKLIEDPTPDNIKRLSGSRTCWSEFRGQVSFFQRALQSEDVGIRKVVFSNCYSLFEFLPSNRYACRPPKERCRIAMRTNGVWLR